MGGESVERFTQEATMANINHCSGATEFFDEEWVGKLSEQYSRILVNHFGEDITQEIFKIALQKIQCREVELPIRNPKAWLYQIGNYLKSNAQRKKKPDISTDDEDFHEPVPQSPNDASQATLVQERNEMIRRAISELDLIYQQVIWLFYIEELSEKKVAKRLGIPKGTVKSRLHKAKKLLAADLKPYILDN
jgi:RNA polymerase sigma factor (sigma-70 family)